MTKTDQERLANIRKDLMQWNAIQGNVSSWDSTFLVNIIDRQSEELRKLKNDLRRSCSDPRHEPHQK